MGSASGIQNLGYFVSIRSGQTCPVCGKKRGRCSEYYNSNHELVFYQCKYAESNRMTNHGWYIHLAKDVQGGNIPTLCLPKTYKKSETTETPVTPENIELRNKVYTKLRQLVKKYTGDFLLPEDREDLRKRGLNDLQIFKMGYFSIPNLEKRVINSEGKKVIIRTAIVKDLEKEFGEKLLQVPGFKISKGKNNSEFLNFTWGKFCETKNKYVFVRGYFVPYHNEKNQIIGLQRYLRDPHILDDKGKRIKYDWVSSQARSGSPIDQYTPMRIIKEDCLLVTEGATKGKIASEYLGLRGMFEAGVSNYKRLVNTVIAVEKQLGKKFNIILALDMDKYENQEVLRAEKKTIELFKASGHQIAIATWDPSIKGIDDALVAGLKIKYQII